MTLNFCCDCATEFAKPNFHGHSKSSKHLFKTGMK